MTTALRMRGSIAHRRSPYTGKLETDMCPSTLAVEKSQQCVGKHKSARSDIETMYSRHVGNLLIKVIRHLKERAP